MNKRELARFKKLIEAERARVRSNLGSIEAEISELTSKKSGSAQGYSNHMADIGSDAMEQEQVFLHASQETDYLKRLDDALRRIEMGTYGVCENCSGKIPVKRLEAYLAAKLCIECKSKMEKLRRN
jgi:DnaK suppressor protein